MKQQRCSGLLQHITSLPSPYGIGDLGPAAYQFADFLAYTRQQIWQVLPLVPVGYGYSPYAGLSTFAGNAMLISPALLEQQGLLWKEDLIDGPTFPTDHVDFEPALRYKEVLLTRAFKRFEEGQSHVDPADFDAFCTQHAAWLDDYALFRVLKHTYGDGVWTGWPEALRTRDAEALADAHTEHARAVRMRKFWQYLFERQWQRLKTYCNERGIQIFGDLPIYVAHDSADVWANQHLFSLDDQGTPTVVSGVPPDYFSETGQRWGNPLYRYDEMAETGFQWWTDRFARILEQVDLVRLDHFRGFAAYWEVPAEEETAINGRWVDGPGAALFSAIQDRLGTLPVIAENLGVITDDVTALMEQFAFPGMAILQFGFDGDPTNEFLPHNYVRNLVAYTGTHDNDTVMGWWQGAHHSTQDAATIQKSRDYASTYLNFAGHEAPHWAFIRALFASVADYAVVPMQDLLGLGSDARMNTPGEAAGNWGWRYRPGHLTHGLADRLKQMTEVYGRAAEPGGKEA